MAKKKSKKKPWLPAVKQVMYEATEKEAIKRYGTKNPAFNYRWEHVNAVALLAKKLAKLTGADKEIVLAAAWLHDVRKDTGSKHPEEGAKFARQFLPSTDFPEKKIEKVAQTIEDHMGLWRDKPLKRLESQVLWDADKLAKIGVTAVFHWTGGDLARGRTRTTQELIDNGRSVDWQEKTVRSMHTKPAKKAAKKRLANYNQLWDSLQTELNGDDLKL